MRGQRRFAVLAGLAAVAVAAAVGYGSASALATGSSTDGAPVITTPAPTKAAGTVTWAVYRETATLDPIKAFDYPDNAAVALTCDSLVRANPDMTLSPGIATMTTPNSHKIVFSLHPGGASAPARSPRMTWSSA